MFLHSFILCCQLIYGLRDPFQPNDRYAYTGWGRMNDMLFGICTIDGVSYRIKKGISISKHKVISIDTKKIVLLDEQGIKRSIYFKKGPST